MNLLYNLALPFHEKPGPYGYCYKKDNGNIKPDLAHGIDPDQDKDRKGKKHGPH